jgi:hypothetical protein
MYIIIICVHEHFFEFGGEGRKWFWEFSKESRSLCLGVLREEEGKRKGGEFHKQ